MTYSAKPNFFALLTLLCLWSVPLFPHPAKAQLSDSLRETLKDAQESSDTQNQLDEKELRNMKTSAPVVVELFTATDCTACVFADRMLYDAMKNKSVIALSCRIKDIGALRSSDEKYAADPGNKKGPMDPCIFRQWTYNSGRTSSDVNLGIPTFIINGFDQVNTGNLVSFEATMHTYTYAAKNKVKEVFMRWKDADTLSISLPRDPAAETKKVNASVWLVRYKDMAVEKVETGQNKGRVLRFSNIVQDIRHISKWHGTAREMTVDVPKPIGGKEKGGYVVLVQEMMGEPVLAAGKLEDYSGQKPQAPAAAPKQQNTPR